jgi:hypothetical protein
VLATLVLALAGGQPGRIPDQADLVCENGEFVTWWESSSR